MIVIYSIIAVFIAWIWVDYFRLIDIYEKEKLLYFIITFILGGASVLLVWVVQYFIFDNILFDLNGEFFNDFIYSVIGVGLVEETAKTIPFFIVLFLFKKQINEPIDFLVYISISALGFSAVENIMYIDMYGPSIINNRAILASVSHMFDTALVAYGIILYKYKKHHFLVIPLFLFFAALSHGFYDFWLIHEDVRTGGWVISIFYFMFTISLFAIILNNALNNSQFFTYKKVIDPNFVAGRLLTYYGIIFVAQFMLMAFVINTGKAFTNLITSVLFTGFIIAVTTIRLSRFKLIRNRWEKLRLELPFSISFGGQDFASASGLRLSVKGHSYNEAYVNSYYNEYFYLVTFSGVKNYGRIRRAYINEKFYYKKKDLFYIAKVFPENDMEEHDKLLLQPKTSGTIMVNEKYPIVAVLKVVLSKNKTRKFKFIEWAYLKPIPVKAG